MENKKKEVKPMPRKKGMAVYLKRDWQLYFLLLFPIICVIVFNYAAYPGLRMAFISQQKGIQEVNGLGLKHSERYLKTGILCGH